MFALRQTASSLNWMPNVCTDRLPAVWTECQMFALSDCQLCELNAKCLHWQTASCLNWMPNVCTDRLPAVWSECHMFALTDCQLFELNAKCLHWDRLPAVWTQYQMFALTDCQLFEVGLNIFIPFSNKRWDGCHLTYLLNHSLTHSIQHSPSWEANQFSASQETPCILWNQKVHWRDYKCLPPVPILSQLDPGHTSPSHFLKIMLILSSHLYLGLSSGFFPAGFLTKTLYAPHLSPPIHTTCPAHLILLDFITWIISGEVYDSLSSSLCNFLHSRFTSSLLGPNILLKEPILRQPQPTFLSHCEWPSFTLGVTFLRFLKWSLYVLVKQIL